MNDFEGDLLNIANIKEIKTLEDLKLAIDGFISTCKCNNIKPSECPISFNVNYGDIGDLKSIVLSLYNNDGFNPSISFGINTRKE